MPWPPRVEPVRVPPPDSYSLRLVAPRRLYDEGVLLGACSSLAPLAPAATVHLNPNDLDRIGSASGGSLRLRSSRSSLVLEALADEGLERGVAVIGFNLDSGDSSGAASLVDAAEAVTEIRLETL